MKTTVRTFITCEKNYLLKKIILILFLMQNVSNVMQHKQEKKRKVLPSNVGLFKYTYFLLRCA